MHVVNFKDLMVFHYHLLPGGVTNVIILSIRIVLDAFPSIQTIQLVTGRVDPGFDVLEKIGAGLPNETRRKLALRVCPELDYISKMGSNDKDQILKTLSGFSRRSALWWVHNHHLGKNPAFTRAVTEYAEKHLQPMLLQIHDFPECARYGNLNVLSESGVTTLYPSAPNVRYALINERDQRLLVEAGIPKDIVFLLNNPVSSDPLPEVDKINLRESAYREAGITDSRIAEKRHLVYPVRSIRRKNVLEACAITTCLPDTCLWVTLAGSSEAEKPYSDFVGKVFDQGLVPGLHDAGSAAEKAGLSFREIVAACDAIISSSVQEGFGYMYINSLKWQKPLAARYLDILDGIRHFFTTGTTVFYDSFLVPITPSRKKQLRREYNAYIRQRAGEAPDEIIDLAKNNMEDIFTAENVDFSYLSVTMQKDVLEKMTHNSQFLRLIKQLNEKLIASIESMIARGNNPAVHDISSRFSDSTYADDLKHICNSYKNNCTYNLDSLDVTRNLLRAFAGKEYTRLLYQEFRGR